MSDRLCNLLVGYWAGLNGGLSGRTPHVEDAIFRAISPNIFMLLREPERGAIFRAAGSFVRYQFGIPINDRDFCEFWTPRGAKIIGSMMDAMYVRNIPIIAQAKPPEGDEHSGILEFALMPVIAADLHWTLGMMVCAGQIRTSPIKPKSLELIKAQPLDFDANSAGAVLALRSHTRLVS